MDIFLTGFKWSLVRDFLLRSTLKGYFIGSQLRGLMVTGRKWREMEGLKLSTTAQVLNPGKVYLKEISRLSGTQHSLNACKISD